MHSKQKSNKMNVYNTVFIDNLQGPKLCMCCTVFHRFVQGKNHQSSGLCSPWQHSTEQQMTLPFPKSQHTLQSNLMCEACN